jgi:hypothetical protein
MSMLALLVLLQTATAGAAVIDDAGTITVTATRLEDLEAAAMRCKRNGCPTREDVATSVAYASALFDKGNYLDARHLLASAVVRTRGAARTEPLAVAQLFNAQATLAMHEGDQAVLRKATWASRNVLAYAAAVPPLTRLTADFRLADWHLRTGDRVGAEAGFAAVAKAARAAGREAVADAARRNAADATGLDALADAADLRRAVTLAQMRRQYDSRVLLETLAARTGPESGDVRRAALATAARLAFMNDDPAAADAFTARLAGMAAGPEPMLLSAPPLPTPGGAGMIDPFTLVSAVASDPATNVTLLWVDIGFWIRPDGRVDDAAILRGSQRTEWAKPLLRYVGGRRYSSFTPDTDSQAGRFRMERYTLTADYVTPIGSLIRRRSDRPRFEMMAMSTEPATP